jgi:hypothetical protein
MQAVLVRRSCLWLLLVFPVLAGASLHAQAYRPIDTGRKAVTLPSAEGLPSITAIAAAPGSGFSILHAREGNVHHFDASGRLLRRFGRVTEGPDAFKRLHSHGWHGQSPWVHDLTARSVTVFDGNTGRVSTSINLPPHGPVQAQGLAPNGAPIVYGGFLRSEGARAQYRLGFALLPGFGMAPKGPFATLPTGDCYLRVAERSVPIPYCQLSIGAVAPNGEWVALVSAAQGAAAGKSALRVVFVTTRGDTLAAVKVEAATASVTSEAAGIRLLEEVRSHRLTGDHEREFRSAVAAQPEYPLATALVATNDRTLWLVQHTAAATRYIVVSTDGRIVARYSTAASLQLMAAAGRTAFGVRTLANGLQQVVRVRF